MEYIPVIGIEIHVELKTKSKMFSSGPVSYGKNKNSQTVLFDLAYPGVLPVVNKQAVRYGIQVASAMEMDIAKVLYFDRKNYFYSDLPKGYQITQNDHPIGSNGVIKITLSDGTVKEIGVERAHLEEDTAKQLHFPKYTLVDYNRCGTPLIEIVSKPEMHTPEEAVKYVEAIHEIITYLDVSDGKMEEGSMRCDVNISLMEKDSDKFGTKVECKNLNSIANVKSALEYEIKRQTELLNNHQVVEQETRRYNDSKGVTELMRKKTDAVDYKYFREPNIAPIKLSTSFIKDAISSMKHLPEFYKKVFEDCELTQYQISQLLPDKNFTYFFYDCLNYEVCSPKILWNLLMGDILSYLNKTEQKLTNLQIDKAQLVMLSNEIAKQNISYQQGKDVLNILLKEDKKTLDIIKSLNLSQVNDDLAIENIVNEVLSLNAQAITDFKNGKDKALGFIVGQVMKASKGKVNPEKAKQTVLNKIGN